MSHTPAPWNVCQGYGETIYAQCVPIATAWTGDGYDWLPGMRFLYPENAKANAHLIASAPELLEELKKTPHDMGCHPSEGVHTERCARVRALIAKAEGRSMLAAEASK